AEMGGCDDGPGARMGRRRRVRTAPEAPGAGSPPAPGRRPSVFGGRDRLRTQAPGPGPAPLRLSRALPRPDARGRGLPVRGNRVLRPAARLIEGAPKPGQEAVGRRSTQPRLTLELGLRERTLAHAACRIARLPDERAWLRSHRQYRSSSTSRSSLIPKWWA